MSGEQVVAKAKKSKTYYWALATWILLFCVNTMGFIDTETNSSLGMGRSWPFSQGGLFPAQWQQSAVIEFTHRSIVSVFMMMLLGLSFVAWRRYGKWIEVKVLIAIMVVFVILEAGLGAVAVLFVNPPAVTATHLGIALISFIGVFLLTSVIKQVDLAGGPKHASALRPALPGGGFAKLTWFALVYLLVAVYFGAYVASTGAGGRFQGWPIPTETYAHAKTAFLIDIGHRSLAFGLLIVLATLTVKAYKLRNVRPDLFKPCLTALILGGCQAVSGALLIYTHLSLVAFLIHVSIVTFMFTCVAYVGLRMLPEPSRRATGDSPVTGSRNSTRAARI